MRNAKLAGAKESLKRIAAKKLQTGSATANVGSAKKEKTSKKKTAAKRNSGTTLTDPTRTELGGLSLSPITRKKENTLKPVFRKIY